MITTNKPHTPGYNPYPELNGREWSLPNGVRAAEIGRCCEEHHGAYVLKDDEGNIHVCGGAHLRPVVPISKKRYYELRSRTKGHYRDCICEACKRFVAESYGRTLKEFEKSREWEEYNWEMELGN